jgi:hypothetical protein
LSIRARRVGLTAAEVEQARQERRSIVWTWCQRGTLHLLSAGDVGWLVPLMGPVFIASNRRRFQELGWDEERSAAGLRLLRSELVKQGSLTRPEVARLLKENHLPYEGQATVHLLFRAALEGILCMGPDRDQRQTYVLVEDWVGKLNPLPRPEDLARLAQRYLEAYAPASPDDLASWSGIKLSDARLAWQLIADQIIQVDAAGNSAWLLKSRMDWLAEGDNFSPSVRLLPRFDTYLLGYARRDLVVDPNFARRVHPGGGIIHPVVLVDGRALGTWVMKRRKNFLEIILYPFESLPDELNPLIEAEVADIGRFLGEEAIWSP